MAEHSYFGLFYVVKILNCGAEDRYIIADSIEIEDDKVTFYGYIYEEERKLKNILSSFNKKFDIDSDNEDWGSYYVKACSMKKLSLKMKVKEVTRGIILSTKEPHIELKLEYDKKSYLTIDFIHAARSDNDLAVGVGEDIYEELDKIIKKYGAKADFGDSLKKDVKDLGSAVAEIGKNAFSGISSDSSSHSTPNERAATKFNPEYMDYGRNKVIYRGDDGDQYIKEGDNYYKI